VAAARRILKRAALALAEAPFVFLLFLVFLAARPLRRRSPAAEYLVCLYATFLFLYLLRLTRLAELLGVRRG
jgi:hypothetical protein